MKNSCGCPACGKQLNASVKSEYWDYFRLNKTTGRPYNKTQEHIEHVEALHFYCSYCDWVAEYGTQEYKTLYGLFYS